MKPHNLLVLTLCAGYLLVGGVALAADMVEASPPSSQDVTPSAALPELVPRVESPSAAESQPKPAEPQSGVAPVDPIIVALQQRIEQLELASAEQLVPKLETFRLYGWIDAGTSKIWLKSTDPANVAVATRSNTFLVGNVNLYFDFQPTENWTSLVEVRLTNLPTTKSTEATGMAAAMSSDQAVVDPTTSFMSYPYLSPIVLERAYIGYRWNDYFQFRIGKFLTPFGIWNVDHGVPTRIALSMPMFMIQGLYPTSQVGAQILGVVHTGSFEIGYVAYASNGRDPDVSKTGNPMYGGRVQIRTSVPWRIQLGFSGLTGRIATEAQVNTGSTMNYSYATTSAYQETDIGVDLSIDIGRLRLRGEYARGSRTYETGLRPAGILPGTYMANSVSSDVYAIAAYRLPWLGLEPYGSMEVYRDEPGFLGEGFLSPSVGLNVYFTAAAQFRIQYNAHYFYRDFLNNERSPNFDKKILMTRFVLGF